MKNCKNRFVDRSGLLRLPGADGGQIRMADHYIKVSNDRLIKKVKGSITLGNDTAGSNQPEQAAMVMKLVPEDAVQHLERRQAIFRQLDFAMGSVLVQRGFSLPDSSNLRRSLGISSKSLVHHWKQAGVGDIPGYATHYQTVSRAGIYARNLGWIGYGLDAATSGIRIKEACTTGTEEHCEVVTYRETGRLAGSITFGNLGAGAGFYLCLALGATTGIGGIACGVILTTTGSVIGGNLGSDLGESAGEMIYRKVDNND